MKRTETETDRQTDRQTETEKQRDRETERYYRCNLKTRMRVYDNVKNLRRRSHFYLVRVKPGSKRTQIVKGNFFLQTRDKPSQWDEDTDFFC
jgi:hypothetical protein